MEAVSEAIALVKLKSEGVRDRFWVTFEKLQHCLYEIAAVSRISFKIYEEESRIDFPVNATMLAF